MCNHVFQGLDTLTPTLTVGDGLKMIGEYEETVGTCYLFSESEAEPKPPSDETTPSDVTTDNPAGSSKEAPSKETRRMESVKMRPGTATKREYKRMELGEEGEELDEAEWLHRAEAQSQRRRRGQRYAFGCALFASLNAILLGYERRHYSPLSYPPAANLVLVQ
ncbi:hypothetical protein C2845_PM15G15420 [Panicum miliaceum]|uniref:Transcription factor TFIIIC triple barrel domain-containing protein n=1 Tax=Panicum miliaceum TaxID=4540 RepID=A0A3L6QDP7_PANMI|nr:hypothetical protein C2845_PM15G15420 [Panicum miliaceum]